ncbi:GNAT family N-acetyltransferase, partial [Methylobacterium goesingense]
MSATSISPDPAPVVEIRPATLADLDALVALEHAAFVGDRAERRAIRHAIRSVSMSLLVAITSDEAGQATLVGSATLERRRGSRAARLSSIAVSPTRSGLGLGSLVL